MSPQHRSNDEAAFWVARLPFPDTASAFQALSTRFPLEILPGTNQGRFIDAKRNPFGFLTQTGLEQLKDTGHRFFNRYNHHGHHLPDRLEWRWDVAQDFLSVWDVNVYSTNYLRTVMSAQSFLDGLLGSSCYVPESRREFNPNVFNEPQVPDHSWTDAAALGNSDELVRVRVRDVSNDPLNAFDRNPELINELVMEVMESTEFNKRDGAAAPLAARLANVLPGLARQHQSDFSKRAPSGINWVEAADHFVCRSAHGLDFAKFSDFEHDDRVEQTLTAMFHPTLTHLAWRFRQWYQNKRLLAAIAAPPLREIADQMTATPELGAGDKRPFTVYSCHDVTILGLLYGIGADFLADDHSSSWRWWPKYGSQLVFELVRVHGGATQSDSYLVRVLLNGKPVLSVDHGDQIRTRAPLGSGPKQLLHVDDFLNVVKALEEAGGHDYDQLLGRK
jgi:Histidine phosphatase superfamily (branch 2)